MNPLLANDVKLAFLRVGITNPKASFFLGIIDPVSDHKPTASLTVGDCASDYTVGRQTHRLQNTVIDEVTVFVSDDKQLRTLDCGVVDLGAG